MDDIYYVKIYYLDNSVEFFVGVIDYSSRIIRVIELDEENVNGYREKGFVNFDAIKKVDIIKKIVVGKE
ncbi:hypothetical protein J4218_02960 [Candidatus Pacearchaeota archaeon]|nr:hypothetical protein [Candidatus Pacearchaeota archaeon]